MPQVRLWHASHWEEGEDGLGQERNKRASALSAPVAGWLTTGASCTSVHPHRHGRQPVDTSHWTLSGMVVTPAGATAAPKYQVDNVRVKMRPAAARGPSAAATRPSFWKLVHLVRRLCIFMCALGYVGQCMVASYTATGLLRGRNNPHFIDDYSTFELVLEYAGNASIRESKLLHNSVLQGSTTPINGTLYLHPKDQSGGGGGVSLTPCVELVGTQAPIYEFVFLRLLHRSLVRGMAYSMTESMNVDLIAPVVDCSTSDITNGDTATGRFFFLERDRNNTEVVDLLVLTMSNQPYRIPAQGERGPAGVATVQHVRDMRETFVDFHFAVSLGYPYDNLAFSAFEYINTTAQGLWLLQSIPRTDDELPFILETANRDGFYIKAESEQSNLINSVWLLETTPRDAIDRWRWIMEPELHDSWAWVHAIHFFIGIGLLGNLVMLCVATYRNFQAGKWWIGDAFVFISTAQIINGVLVLVSWFMNEYWVLHEFALGIGYELMAVNPILVYESPMRVSLFTIYLSACGIIGHLLHERIDPLLATACFHIGFDLRLQIHNLFPDLRESIVEYAHFAFKKSITQPRGTQVAFSPMHYWSPHPIGQRNYTFVIQTLFPIYITLVLVVVYAVARKIYHRFYPPLAQIQRTLTATGTSTNENALVSSHKRLLTLFEIATGAELENRFGLVSDYETCIFIKGMKFASADGIYSTGFVIANKKYLLQTNDYWSIVLMKILRKRFRNIYVYDVNGSTVQQTARLVYPHTLSVQDLLNINVSVLS